MIIKCKLVVLWFLVGTSLGELITTRGIRRRLKSTHTSRNPPSTTLAEAKDDASVYDASQDGGVTSSGYDNADQRVNPHIPPASAALSASFPPTVFYNKQGTPATYQNPESTGFQPVSTGGLHNTKSTGLTGSAGSAGFQTAPKPVAFRPSRPSGGGFPGSQDSRQYRVGGGLHFSALPAAGSEPKTEEYFDGNTYHGANVPHAFGYAVQDDYFGNQYLQNQVSDGEVTKGEYRVLLPDGRTQIVTYSADAESGFMAHVAYEGEARPYEPAKGQPTYVPPGALRGGQHTPVYDNSGAYSK